MNNQEIQLYRGALLHDIGKMWQRSGETKRKKHQLLSSRFIEQWLQDDVVSHIVANHHISDWRSSVEDSVRHRLALIVCEADSLSSRERNKSKKPYIRPLDSIFNEIKIKGRNIPTSHIQPQSFLSSGFKKYEFPQKYDTKKEDDKIKRKVAATDVWYAFERELKEMEGKFATLDEDTLLYLYKKYLWCIPSAYFFQTADISLYDHSRMTAAIALCLYKSIINEYNDIKNAPYEVIEDRKVQRYLLIGGGFSGVQKYLYGIAHKGALKGLKGRSFWLNQAIDSIARMILDECGLPEANLIYANGGRFYILAPSFLKDKILKIKSDIEDRILKHDEKNLGLEFSCIELTGHELGSPEISQKWGELNNNIAISKLQKLQSAWSLDFFAPHGPGGKIVQCQYTKKDLCTVNSFALAEKSGSKQEAEMEFIRYNVDQQNIYITVDENDTPSNERAIAEEQYLGQVIGRHIRDEKQVIGFSQFYQGQSSEDNTFSILDYEFLSFYKEDEQPQKSLSRVAWLNDDEFTDYQPQMPFKRIWKFYGGNWVLKNEDDHKLKDFEELANECLGIKRLAILRMDVDNLGLIFKDGFKEMASFSRIAQLSTMLDFFFCGYINKLKELYWKAGVGIVEKAQLTEDEIESQNCTVKSLEKVLQIVYAGGDDLFIVGIWNVIPDVALWINDKFRTFTIQSPSFTLSAGVSLFRPKYPMYKAAKRAGNAEQKAKKYSRYIKELLIEKDAIGVFGEVADWGEFKVIAGWVNKIYSWTKKAEYRGSLDKSIISKLASIYSDYLGQYNLYIKNEEQKEKNTVSGKEVLEKTRIEKEAAEKALWSRARWQAAYTLQRFAEQNKTYKKEIKELSSQLFLDQQLIKKLGILTQWADLLTREITQDEDKNKR